jgi:hypothetical protein
VIERRDIASENQGGLGSGPVRGREPGTRGSRVEPAITKIPRICRRGLTMKFQRRAVSERELGGAPLLAMAGRGAETSIR